MATLARPRADGSGTERDHWQQALSSRHASSRAKARAALAGPPVPPNVAYLLDWTFAVHGQSGYTMDGPIPATYDTIQRVLAAIGVRPPPTEDELTAVRQLDTAYIVASRPVTKTSPTPTSDEERPRGRR